MRVDGACRASRPPAPADTRPIGRPERICLRQDDSERHQVVDVGAELHVLERVLTGESELHLPEREPQLVAHRRLEARARDLHGLLQPETGGNGDRHEVEQIREVVGDLLTPFLDAMTEPPARYEASEHRENEQDGEPQLDFDDRH